MEKEGAKPTLFQRVFQVRFLVYMFLFFSNSICYLDRTNFSVALIPMSKDLGWSSLTQGYVLSAFYLGYILTQILGGVLSKKYGGKYVLFYGVYVWSVFTIITPVAAIASRWFSWGISLVILARVGMGLGEGVNFPTIHELSSKWIPKNQISMFATIIGAGTEIGTILAFTMSPYVSIYLNWRWIFYICGFVGFVWGFFFLLFASSTPQDHHFISDYEKKYLTENTMSAPEKTTDLEQTVAYEPKTADFLSSPAVWAIFISHFAINFGFFISIGWLPKYFSYLGVNFASLGFISFLPYLSQFCSAIIAGMISDFMINRFKFSTNVMRKTMNTVSAFGSAICFLTMIFVKNVVVLIILSIFAIAFLGVSKAGYWVNVIDIAPKHAGLILGISNTMATIPGIVGNIVTGWMLDYFGGSWTPVFILIIVTDVIGGLAFLIFSKGEPIFK